MGLGRVPVRRQCRPRVHRLRRRQIRPAGRHPVRDLGEGRALRRSDPAMDGRDRQGADRVVSFPDLRGGRAVDDEHAGLSGDRHLLGRRASHGTLAARARVLRRQTRRSDGNGFFGHSGDPRDREDRGSRDGAPAHRAVRLSRRQPRADRRRSGRGAQDLGRGEVDDGRPSRRLPAQGERPRGARLHARGTCCALREAVADRQLPLLPERLQRRRDE